MMRRFIKKRSSKSGLPPGSLVHIGERKAGEVKIRILDYDEDHLEDREVKNIEEIFPFKDKPTVTWINIDGLHEVSVIEKLGDCFELHPLLLEDILNTDQRPKMEDYGSYIYVVLKMLHYDGDQKEINSEQISLILGPNFVISIQEREGDVFNPIRDRLAKNKGRIRKTGPDYLAYSLLDAIVDNYFLILENVGMIIEDTEQELTVDPSPETLQNIRKLKNEMIFLRKSVWPLREVINGLERGESDLIKKSTNAYLRDIYDHTIQVIDAVESYRDMISGMVDIYLSSLSNKMNAVMKVLTVFASIFIPLTFFAGVFGMNFEYLPGLKWHWGYFLFWGGAVVVAVAMVLFFRRKKWL